MKSKVVEQMVQDGAPNKAQAEQAFDAVFKAVQAVLAKNEDVRINGFGTFKRKFQEGRNARNPRTGEMIAVAARHVVKFTASKTKA